MATDSAVTCITYTKNDCPKVSASGMKNCGRCQQAQRSPSRTLARARPKRVARRGSAYPRQPIPSPAWKGVPAATNEKKQVHNTAEVRRRNLTTGPQGVKGDPCVLASGVRLKAAAVGGRPGDWSWKRSCRDGPAPDPGWRSRSVGPRGNAVRR